MGELPSLFRPAHMDVRCLAVPWLKGMAAIGLMLVTVLLNAPHTLGAPQPVPPSAPSPSPANPTAPSAVTTELELFSAFRQALTEERQVLEAQAQRHFDALENLRNWTISALGLITALALGVFYWLFGSTREQVEKAVRNRLESYVRARVESDLHPVIEREVSRMQEMYQSLKAQLDALTVRLDRRVVWVLPGASEGSSEEPEGEPQMELAALQEAGLSKIQLVTPAWGEPFELGEPDLVILSYRHSQEGRRQLQTIVDYLKTKTPPVPLLIYTYRASGDQIQLGAAERAILNGFHWHLPVNWPTTLLAQAQALIRRGRPT